MKKNDVFISYCRDDSKLAMTICRVLKNEGVSYWFDEEAIGAGDTFSEAIAEGILSSRVVILVSSRSSEKSPFVKKEISYAYKNGIDVIPYKIDKYDYDKNISNLINTTNYINAVSRPYDEFDALIKGVYKKLGKDYKEKDFEFTYDGKTRRKIKNIKKPEGLILFFILMAEALVLSVFISLFLSRYFAVLILACLLTVLIYPFSQRTRCSVAGCKKKREKKKFKFLSLNGKRVKRIGLCSEHKHTIGFCENKEHSMLINSVLVIVIAALLVFTVVNLNINTETIAEAFSEAVTFDEKEYSYYWAQETGNAFGAMDKNSVYIMNDGSVYAFDENQYPGLNDFEDIRQISVSNTNILALSYGGEIYTEGQNTFDQLDIEGISQAVTAVEAGNGFAMAVTTDKKVFGFGKNDFGQLEFDGISNVERVSAGYEHALALLYDGTVVARGDNTYSQCDVEEWVDIIQIDASKNISAGLKSDGTVVTTIGEMNWTDIIRVCAGDGIVAGLTKHGNVLLAGNNKAVASEVSAWKDIVSIDISGGHIIGLKSDYTLVDASIDGNSYVDETQTIGAGLSSVSRILENTRSLSVSDEYGVFLDEGKIEIIGNSPDVLLVDFEDIKQIRANRYTIVGLKNDGTLVNNSTDQSFDIYDWNEIQAFDMSDGHIVGIRKDGTAVAAGDNSYGQCDVEGYSEIVDVSVSENRTVLLKSDGTAVFLGERSADGFTADSILFAEAAKNHTAAVLSDGTVTAVGSNDFGQCETEKWTDIVQVAVGDRFTIGLKSDGSAVSAGAVDLSGYDTKNNIISIGANGDTFFLQKQDGEFIYSISTEG